MNISKFFTAFLLVLCFILIGCDSTESPEPAAEVPANTVAAQIGVRPTQTPTPMPTTTVTVTVTPEPSPTIRVETATTTITVTPRPTHVQSSELPLTTRDAPPPPTPTPSITPTPLPTPYLGDWVSGFILDRGNNTFEFHTNSMEHSNGASITYEPLNQAAAEVIANLDEEIRIVLFGEYVENVSGGEFAGHMIVEHALQLFISYSPETPFSAVYVHPDNLFSFSYPENWPFWASENGDSVSVSNSPPFPRMYYGFDQEYRTLIDIGLSISVVRQPLDEYILELQQEAQGTQEIFVSQQERSGWMGYRITISYLDDWGGHTLFVIEADETTVLVFTLEGDRLNFTDRLLSTLVINPP